MAGFGYCLTTGGENVCGGEDGLVKDHAQVTRYMELPFIETLG